VVGVTAAIVADRAALVVGDFAQIGNQLLDRQLFEFSARDGRVDVIDICLVVLRVMDFHRPSIDVRLPGVVGIREGRKRVSHG